MDLNLVLTAAQIADAIGELLAWPMRVVVQIRGLFDDAWRLRHNFTFADAVYVALSGAPRCPAAHR